MEVPHGVNRKTPCLGQNIVEVFDLHDFLLISPLFRRSWFHVVLFAYIGLTDIICQAFIAQCNTSVFFNVENLASGVSVDQVVDEGTW